MIKKVLLMLIIFILLIICLGTVEGADITIEDGIAINSINNINNINDTNNTDNITVPNITTYIYTINNNDTLKNVSGEIFYSKNKENNVYLVNVVNDINFTSWSEHLNTFHLDGSQLFISGNGHTINLQESRLNDEYHFAQINNKSMLYVVNLTISGFNSPIMNQGISFFNNCTFINNHIKYSFFSGDEAGAIYNQGYLTCINCTFTNNSGNYAGAIFSSNGAINSLNNCTFNNNSSYRSDGATLYNYNKAQYIINDVNATKDNRRLDVSIAYDYAPGTFSLKNIEYKLLKGLSYVVSGLVGFIGGAIGSVPGAWVGTILGTFLGSAIDLVADSWFYNSIHNFTELDVGTICTSTFIHFFTALSGALIGVEYYGFQHSEDVLNPYIKDSIQKIRNVNGKELRLQVKSKNFVKMYYSDIPDRPFFIRLNEFKEYSYLNIIDPFTSKIKIFKIINNNGVISFTRFA